MSDSDSSDEDISQGDKEECKKQSPKL